MTRPEPASSPPQRPTALQPSGRLRRGDRLLHKGDFDVVFQRGRRAQGRHLHAIVSLGRGQHGQPRLGLAVAKAAGHAPARARLRRLTRDAFRALRPLWSRPFDLVVSIRQPWPDAALDQVLEELLELSQKLRLLA